MAGQGWGMGRVEEDTVGKITACPLALTVGLLSLTKGVLSLGDLRAPWKLLRVAWRRAATGKVLAGPPALHFGRMSPYQVNAIQFYVLEKDAGRMPCVPLHTWVIWEIPGRKKHNLSTVSNQTQTFP